MVWFSLESAPGHHWLSTGMSWGGLGRSRVSYLTHFKGLLWLILDSLNVSLTHRAGSFGMFGMSFAMDCGQCRLKLNVLRNGLRSVQIDVECRTPHNHPGYPVGFRVARPMDCGQCMSRLIALLLVLVWMLSACPASPPAPALTLFCPGSEVSALSCFQATRVDTLGSEVSALSCFQATRVDTLGSEVSTVLGCRNDN